MKLVGNTRNPTPDSQTERDNMFSETKICIGCGEEFQIFHKVQRQKKYCGGKCADAKWAGIRKETRMRKRKK